MMPIFVRIVATQTHSVKSTTAQFPLSLQLLTLYIDPCAPSETLAEKVPGFKLSKFSQAMDTRSIRS